MVRLSCSFWYTKNRNNNTITTVPYQISIISHYDGRVCLTSPVSAKAEKGTACLSLLSDSNAMAMWPLISSSWLGRWMDWQTEVKTSPIRLQSSSLVQSCQGEKHQLQSTNVSGRIRPTKTRTNLYFHDSVGHIQVPQTGDRDSSSLLTKAKSISRYGDGL